MSDEEITDEVETVEYQLDEEGNPILDEEGNPIPVPQGFQPYEVTVGEAIYTVLEPSEPDTHRVRTPEGVVTAIPCTDSAEDTLTAEQVQDWLDNPPPFPAFVPDKVSRRQLFLALLDKSASLTRAQIRGMLEGNEVALIEFDEAIEFHRQHSLVLSLASALSLSSDEVDEIFAVAAGL